MHMQTRKVSSFIADVSESSVVRYKVQEEKNLGKFEQEMRY
jgi:hypothetical protein